VLAVGQLYLDMDGRQKRRLAPIAADEFRLIGADRYISTTRLANILAWA
jgi:hypothetical protein